MYTVKIEEKRLISFSQIYNELSKLQFPQTCEEPNGF